MVNQDSIHEPGLYINPMTDYGFKRIFGDECVTTAFLNDLLNPEPKIQNVIFLNKEEQAENEDGKGVVYDIRCELEDGTEIIIELPLIKDKRPEDCKDKIEYWIYNIYNLENMTTALPFQTQQPAFARMGDLANFANMSFEQQESYMRRLDTWRTVMAAEEFTFNKGYAEGYAKGRAEGREEEALDSARKMIAAGVPKELVLSALGLT